MTELERIKIAVKALISLGIAKNQEGVGILMGYKSKSSFSQILNGLVPLPSDFVDRLCKLDDRLVKMWIISEQGDVLKAKDLNKQVYIDKEADLIKEPKADIYKLNNLKNSIPLISIEAMSGFDSVNFQLNEKDTEYFVVPVFKGADYLITVRGSSMYPKYNSGDIVACRHLPLDTFFQWNKVYVLYTNQGVLVNRVCKSANEDYVLIVSDNENYESFELSRKDIRSLAIVIGVIRSE